MGCVSIPGSAGASGKSAGRPGIELLEFLPSNSGLARPELEPEAESVRES